MKKEFCIYTQALALKELGFNEPCFGAFDEDGCLFIYWNDDANKNELFISQENCEKFDYVCLALTKQQIFDFFREMYPHIDFGFAKIYNGTNNYHYHINLEWQFFEGTYEEAELACIDQLIELINNK